MIVICFTVIVIYNICITTDCYINMVYTTIKFHGQIKVIISENNSLKYMLIYLVGSNRVIPRFIIIVIIKK